MAEHDEDICLRIQALNAQQQPLGGTVDIACKPGDDKGTVYIHAANAAKEIDVRGLRRDCVEPYDVTVTPTGSTQGITHQVTIPARGSATLQFVFATGQSSTSNALSGTLVFDNGLPAASIATRAYSVGFAGQDTLLGQATTGTDGSYAISYRTPASGAANLQVRVLDSTGAEVTLSNTKYNAAAQEALNLVVPSTVQPLAPEFQRLASDMELNIGGVANLAQAQENAAQQDLTLLNQSTNWDARVTALGALSAQNSQTTGIQQEALYALYRFGLPTDPGALATVPSSTVQQALTTAVSSGVSSLSDDQVTAAVSAFNTFAGQSHLTAITPGGVSNFGSMAAAKIADVNLQGAFTSLYIGDPNATDFWDQAAQLNIGADTLSALKVQGKFLYLTFNNVALADALQKTITTSESLSQLATLDYDVSDTWQTTLQNVVTSTPNATLDSLIPSVYTGATEDRLAAYTGDLARKVRISFPTQVAARMIERNQLAVSAPTAAPATAFLRSAADLGYSLGRTPLNAFLANTAGQLPALDADSLETVKTLHRIYQITPSTESFQAALTAGFTSARQIASMAQDDFLNKYGSLFPPYEAGLIYGRAQTVSSVTFNVCSSAILMDTAPPVYTLSAGSAQKQAAKNSLIQQFPSIASLFGNLDYCECQDCSSVLSPAAYFVDVLEFLGPSNPSTGSVGSAPNPSGFTPLDVLIGGTNSSNVTVPGRRPDLGALPLTCENTNTSMPYIDLVNEILEYYVAYQKLDTGLAYDTGTATTAELTAEPQNIVPIVYTQYLKQALFPLDLPFDLWIATVRGFLGYFKTQFSQVLDTLRPVDALDLFTDGSNFPYYRAQIFAESLGFSPSEYTVLTGTSTALAPGSTNWFKLYGYPDAGSALSGNATLDPLSSAENLAQVLGLTYQQVTDLLETSFINPGLYPLIYQFQRLGIDMSDAFSYTGQTGYPALSAAAQTAFEAQLNAITARYAALNKASSFEAIAWLKALLPAGYSSKVLVLADPDSGCNFGATTLKYADNVTAATAFDFVRINLFVRLWQKLGWTMGEVDRALQAFFPTGLPAWGAGSDAAFTSAWQTALVYLAHLDALNTQLAPAMGRDALLPLWSNLPVQGPNPLYGQLFLSSSVLNNDSAFDDPAGNFPVPIADLTAASLQTFSAHLPSIQGALGLASADIDAIFADPGVVADMVVAGGNNVPAFTLNNLSICYRYSTLANCLNLSDDDANVEDMIGLKQMSGLNPFQPVTGSSIADLAQDVLFNNTLQFVKDAQSIQASGFTVEDLQYLLRHQFDPVGKYQVDQNALLTLLQQTVNGLAQIQSQNALPANLLTLPETLLDQMLSGLIPTAILKSLFALLTNAQDLTASITGVTPAIDPTPFAGESGLSFTYFPVPQTQTVTYGGLLLDWKKAELLTLNSTPEFTNLLNLLQQAGTTALAQNFGNILGTWASLVEYEAVEPGPVPGLPADELTATDPALSLSFDEVGGLQWAGYRGVLTDANKDALTAVAMPSPALATLLSTILADLQSQSLPAYQALADSLLAMLANAQTFSANATGVTAANQVDGTAFASAVATAQQQGTIAGPVPPIQFSYDPGSQIQTIVVQGILTDVLRGQIAGLPTVSATAAALLQSVRDSMATLFQSLASGLVTVAVGDLDNAVAPFLGLNATQSQRQAKAELVNVFLPLEAQKLSLDFVLQTLTSTLSSDASLTRTLVTDTALLSDPSNPGKSLQQSFLALGQPGVSASYFAADGTLLASGLAATADTADPTNPVTNVAGCQFAGYLQVPTDGPYRFFAELGNAGATASLVLTAPPNSQLLASPILSDTEAAAADHAEISQFVNLQGGVFYQFTFALAKLGSNGGSLLVQSENMPKGPLSQVALCPQTSADDFLGSYTLLSKALQILETTGIDEREIGYMIANATQFGNLRLSSLPTQPSDANMVTLFAQMLTLIDYADLRKNPARGTDGLIDVFKGVGVAFTESPGSAASNANPATPWAALAALFRRNVADVRAIAEYFGLIQNTVAGAVQTVTAIGDFGNNKGIRRIWQALQLIQILGIPVSAITASTMIASLAPAASAPTPDKIATNFKNAVKAQYTTNQWLPIAQSVFDPLRKMKRDALVSYLIHNLPGIENENQLFEYFLVDPGMEPVVQTSRLRLAMSSLQTFVQRCLLNLENANASPAINVSPAAIDADVWSWMKRYRVWQANREIFLYPENWMEPELRTGMTDLFQTLESDLLQGDVTDDLATQAFLDYLTGLEQRARLDVVACYLDQTPNTPVYSTLHVLARNYGHPHKYFYRTYASGVWAAWEAVTPDIDGDHIALAFWKGRLNVFWVTFIIQTQAPAAPPAGGQPVTSLKFGDLADSIVATKSTKLVQVQLHWCEYYQGKWSKRISSDINKYDPIAVEDTFDPSTVRIWISKDGDESVGEGAVKVHLDFPPNIVIDPNYLRQLHIYSSFMREKTRFGGAYTGPTALPNYSFRVTSKNCDLVLEGDWFSVEPMNPYVEATTVDATMFNGEFTLSSSFQNNFTSTGTSSTTTEPILQTVNSYALLPCSNPVTPSPLLTSSDPDYLQSGSLVSPFFYKDIHDTSTTDEMTFYVQPNLTETTISEWTGWAVVNPGVNQIIGIGQHLGDLPVIAQVPVAGPKLPPVTDPIYSIYAPAETADWLTAPATTVLYNGALVGQTGGLNTAAVPAVIAGKPTAPTRNPIAQSTHASSPRGLFGQHGLAADQVRRLVNSARAALHRPEKSKS